jgi:hypothetical protein
LSKQYEKRFYIFTDKRQIPKSLNRVGKKKKKINTMSQVKLSKSQLAVLDAIIAIAEENGQTTGPLTKDFCFLDCIVQTALTVAQTATPTLVTLAGGAAAASSPKISVDKLIEYRKNN